MADPTILTTSQLDLPPEILTPWVGKIKGGSTVATLSPAQPMTFGRGQAMAFDVGEAEYVGEGQNHGPSAFKKTVQRTEPFKFHKTVRWTDEVKYADEDEQLHVLEQILNLLQPALSRALDFGVIHGINPTSGAPVAAMTQRLTNATSKAEFDASQKPYLSVDAAKALVLANGYTPSGIALDPSFAAPFATARSTQTEQRLYPDLSLATEKSRLESMDASVSRTVGAVGVAATPTNLKAVVGDFGGVRWGIQRSLGLELIEYGDPDGQGDLKRKGEVAFRAEVLYGWGINDIDAFSLIVDEEA
ncbi:phage major capsid protein [Leucobacter chromiiresistens]